MTVTSVAACIGLGRAAGQDYGVQTLTSCAQEELILHWCKESN